LTVGEELKRNFDESAKNKNTGVASADHRMSDRRTR
jgi:hypothetical protein